MKKILFSIIGFVLMMAMILSISIYAADGTATITSTVVKTAWGCEFTTTVALSEMTNMNETEFVLAYDQNVVKLEAVAVKTGVTATEANGKITFSVTGMSGKTAMDLADITFTTSENAPFGKSDYLSVSAPNLTANLNCCTIYKKGDVSMDGFVNVLDLGMIRASMLNKRVLTDAQKKYANTHEDFNADNTDRINVADLGKIRSLMLNKITTLDNRITVTMTNPDGTSKQISMIPSTTPKYYLEKGELSMSTDSYSAVDFSTITADTTLSVWIPEKPNVFVAPAEEETNIGEIVTYTVKLICAEDITAIGIIPKYDETAYELVSGEWLASGFISDFSVEEGNGVIAFDGNFDVNEPLFTFSLKVIGETDTPVSCEFILKDEMNADISYEIQ